MSSYDMYKEDIAQEQALALWLAEQQYGNQVDDHLKNKIKANARKNFSAKFIYGGAVSIPLLRSCDSEELKEIKRGISTSIDVDDQENPLHLESYSNTENEIITEELETLLFKNAPIFWGILEGSIGLMDFNTHSRRKAVMSELIPLLHDLHPDKSHDEIEDLAEACSRITWRDQDREEGQKIIVKKCFRRQPEAEVYDNSEQFLTAQGTLF
ncbi:MAG: hypothetical protein IBX55_11665 [Methyloprofundus sp.]|uniref:hypothetical protein n=1 Tax=Thiomicrospira sp. TaxID=935 RepID=UPI0019E027F9|nr:hypothetical protein [Methyloprofundus sp.]